MQNVKSQLVTPIKYEGFFKYDRKSINIKQELIFRVMYLNENIRTVCHELDFNFSTGRNLIQRYKKTGKYAKFKDHFPKENLAFAVQNSVTKESKEKIKRCNLGIILFDDNLRLVNSKNYTKDEENQLMELHKKFTMMGIV